MLNTRILKLVREANAQNTLRVNELGANQLTEVINAIYTKPRSTEELK